MSFFCVIIVYFNHIQESCSGLDNDGFVSKLNNFVLLQTIHLYLNTLYSPRHELSILHSTSLPLCEWNKLSPIFFQFWLLIHNIIITIIINSCETICMYSDASLIDWKTIHRRNIFISFVLLLRKNHMWNKYMISSNILMCIRRFTKEIVQKKII